MISDDTFEYMAGWDMTYGGFNWKLNFRWYPVPQREMDRRKGRQEHLSGMWSISSKHSMCIPITIKEYYIPIYSFFRLSRHLLFIHIHICIIMSMIILESMEILILVLSQH